ncbi:MAG TPA: IscS subfamily cysteine desulfurase [Planctomycetaceae bacterium]|jgi:cysteine desulfurase|nr:IscS subfamily cysteine desulfurase [Planctomycetaceae bacterium]HCK55064.1 IscS subfamily cysteine desulfurase [Planctomycetaceae bacterium]
MPAKHPPRYLDNHATTRTDPRVVEAMLPFFSERFGNAASIGHSFGEDAARAVETARHEVASLVGARPEEVIFTSGATEANNLALKGLLSTSGNRRHLVVSDVEHPSVLDPVARLARTGCRVTRVGCDTTGQVDPAEVAAAIEPDTALVSVMWANNEVGTINPVAEIADRCVDAGVVFHTDAVQAVGRIPVNCRNVTAGLLSLSAHKIYGPKGIGALVVRRGSQRIRLLPQIEGGGHEAHLRSGTLPVPLIVGFGTACRLAADALESESVRLAGLAKTLAAGIGERLEGVHINGHPDDRLPGNMNLGFEGVDGDALQAGLKRIAVSSGSACTTADPGTSHVLAAMGVPETLSRASLRFGLGRFNTEDDILAAIDEIVETVERLRTTTRPG